MLRVVISLISVGLFLSAAAASAEWRSRLDNKSLTDLKGMDEDELLSEASDVCIHLAAVQQSFGQLTDPDPDDVRARLQNTVDAHEYLHMVANVARKKNGGEKYPAWMDKIFGITGADKPDPDQCVTIYKVALDQLKKKKQSAKAASLPAASAPSAESRLRSLKDLLDKGLISKDEYEQKRAEVLKGL